MRAGRQCWTYRSTKAKRELGWKPRPHEETLEATVAWYLEREHDRIVRSRHSQGFQYRAAGGGDRAPARGPRRRAPATAQLWARPALISAAWPPSTAARLPPTSCAAAERSRAACARPGIEYDEVRVPFLKRDRPGGRGADRPALGTRCWCTATRSSTTRTASSSTWTTSQTAPEPRRSCLMAVAGSRSPHGWPRQRAARLAADPDGLGTLAGALRRGEGALRRQAPRVRRARPQGDRRRAQAAAAAAAAGAARPQSSRFSSRSAPLAPAPRLGGRGVSSSSGCSTPSARPARPSRTSP